MIALLEAAFIVSLLATLYYAYRTGRRRGRRDALPVFADDGWHDEILPIAPAKPPSAETLAMWRERGITKHREAFWLRCGCGDERDADQP